MVEVINVTKRTITSITVLSQVERKLSHHAKLARRALETVGGVTCRTSSRGVTLVKLGIG